MQSHFHGSLCRPTRAVTSPHQQHSSFATLPAPSYQTQPSSLTSPDGNPSLRTLPPSGDTTFSSVPVGTMTAMPMSSQSVPPAPIPDIICCLCDKIADTKLIPCNHVVLCSEHAQSSKKCPECRVSLSARCFVFMYYAWLRKASRHM